ncbi:MAG TPA: hypothetical protein VK476_04165, partial [Flavobacterium sp.]|nr:hypothetical protein [Flavobacterium sp.]
MGYEGVFFFGTAKRKAGFSRCICHDGLARITNPRCRGFRDVYAMTVGTDYKSALSRLSFIRREKICASQLLSTDCKPETIGVNYSNSFIITFY